MPLIDLNTVLTDVSNRLSKKTYWPEMSLSDNLKAELSSVIPNLTKLDEKTGTAKSTEGNLIIFPYQYFSFIVSIKDLLNALSEYFSYYNLLIAELQNIGLPVNVIGEIIRTCTDAKVNDYATFAALCKSRGGNYKAFVNAFDQVLNQPNDRNFFVKFLFDSSYRRGKEIANVRSGNSYHLRSPADIYGSIVLSVVNIPNASSGYFGDLAYTIATNKAVLTYLINELEPKLNYSANNDVIKLKNATLRDFVFESFKFLKGNFDEGIILPKVANKAALIGNLNFSALTLPDYFGPDTFIGTFPTPQTTSITSGNTKRFFDEDLQLQAFPNSYLTTQWNDTPTGNLTFGNFQKYVADVSENRFEAVKNGKEYLLIEHKPKVNYPINQILYGPPGTGKTHNVITHALAIINDLNVKDLIEQEKLFPEKRKKHKAEFEKYIKEGRIEFVTFHQSYSYEEFVEGIKANVNEKNEIYYDIEPGIFKRISIKAAKEFINNNFDEVYTEFQDEVRQSGTSLPLTTIGQGAPFDVSFNSRGNSVAKPRTEKGTAMIVTKESIRKYLVEGEMGVYPSYIKAIGDHIKNKYQFKSNIKRDPLKKYVLIIDEINRGNISKIFGELITLIESTKRIGESEELRLNLAYSGRDEDEASFGVPSNLYILATMNSTDRSIALIDTALRRRFTFKEQTADSSLVSDNVDGINLRALLTTINERIEYLLDKDHLIGHAYFMHLESKNDVCAVFRNKILPLLQEYFYNDFYKIQLVLGDNKETKKEKGLRLVELKDTSSPKNLFGKEIDGYDGKEIYVIREDLLNENYDKIESAVFISIYDNKVVTDSGT